MGYVTTTVTCRIAVLVVVGALTGCSVETSVETAVDKDPSDPIEERRAGQVEITANGLSQVFLGDEYSYCERERLLDGGPFELDLDIRNEDGHGFRLTFEAFIGLTARNKYPLVAKTFTKSFSGTANNNEVHLEVSFDHSTYENSEAMTDLRARATACTAEFTKTEDGILTGTLSCARMYDELHTPLDVEVSFRCQLAEPAP
jgi:hypothetical protein